MTQVSVVVHGGSTAVPGRDPLSRQDQGLLLFAQAVKSLQARIEAARPHPLPPGHTAAGSVGRGSDRDCR